MMNNAEIQMKMKSIKSKIEKWIEEGHLKEALEALDDYEAMVPGDPEIYSMRAVIHIINGSFEEAEAVLLDGLKKDSVHFDLLFNLAYLNEQQGQYQTAADLYTKTGTVAYTESQKQSVDEAIERLKAIDEKIVIEERAKIVVFVKEGLDSFLGDIINGLSEDYWVRRIIVKDLKQIDEGMMWADVCWFEWCDELVAYASKLPIVDVKKIICRLHSYEAFTQSVSDVEWGNIDKVIFVAEHIRSFVLENNKKLHPDRTIVIPNGLDPDKYKAGKRSPGFNIAYLGYINYKKGPMLLLHTFKAIFDKDSRYKLFIAGTFQDSRDSLYFNQMIEEFGIQNNVFYEGWQDNVDEWLEDKNYIICSSVLESQNMSVMQAMCKGIKPIVHNFVGAKSIYPEKYVWNTINEAVNMVLESAYYSEEYRSFIEKNYSLEKQMDKITALMNELLSFRTVLQKVSDILSGKQIPEELATEDLTVLIPCYNRAELLRDDILKGYKLSNQPKLIVDDCSDEFNKGILVKLLADSKNREIENIIFHDKNAGVASAVITGVNNANSKHLLFCGDDDILICNKSDETDNLLSGIGNKAAFIIPRHIVNMDESGEFSSGYDRLRFQNMKSSQILKHLFQTGEMQAMIAGAIFRRDDLLKCLPDTVFRVSEDYVTVSRILALFPELPIYITDSLIYIRRLSKNTLSKRVNCEKLSLNLMSLMVSGYYCVKDGFINEDEFISALKNREDLLNSIYGYDKGFAGNIIDFVMGEISFEDFITVLQNGRIPSATLTNVPEELIKLPTVFGNNKEQ